MKRTNIIILTIVIVLTAVAAFFALSQSNYIGGKKELRDFAIEDTASVDKIFLVNKQNQQVLLEKIDGVWMLNKEHKARKDFVNLLLKTIHRVYVKAPVANAAMENIIKSLASKSTKVEIYQHGKLAKTYYVGGPTQDQHGTYMLLENSSRPFVMSIPGFRGYLSTRYTTNPYDWRTQEIFNYDYQEIAEVTIKNYENSVQSFKAINNRNNTFELIDLKSNKNISEFDTIAVKKFIARFTNVNFDKFLEGTDEAYVRDSLQNAIPAFEVTVKNINNEENKIFCYRRPNYRKLQADDGSFYPYDVDFLYGLINDKTELVMIQYYVFDPILVELDDFRNEE